MNYDTDSRHYKLILMDGSAMWFRGAGSTYCHSSGGGITNSCGKIYYDVNGSKEPNTWGIDIFSFELTPGGLSTNKTNDCSKTGNGGGCSTYIIQYGNMNYLH